VLIGYEMAIESVLGGLGCDSRSLVASTRGV